MHRKGKIIILKRGFTFLMRYTDGLHFRRLAKRLKIEKKNVLNTQ